MADIFIDIAKAKGVLEKERSLSGHLRTLYTAIEDERNKLRYEIAGREQISAHWQQVSQQIKREADTIYSMGSALQSIVESYEYIEKTNLNGQVADKTSVQSTGTSANQKIANLLANYNLCQNPDEQSKIRAEILRVIQSEQDGEKKFSLTDAKDLLGFWKDIVSLVKKDSDIREDSSKPWMGLLGDVVSTMKAAIGLKESETTPDFCAAMLSYLKSGCKINNSVLDLFDHYGVIGDKDKSFCESLGLLSAGTGFLESIVKGYNKSGGINAEFWKNSSDITSGIEDIWSSCLDISGKWSGLKGMDKVLGKYQYQVSTVAPVKAVFDMGAYYLSDIWQRTEDGEFDIDDCGAVLRGTGFTGANTLISAATFGIISPEASDWERNFREAQQATYNVADYFGISGTARKIFVGSSSVLVSSWTATIAMFKNISSSKQLLTGGV